MVGAACLGAGAAFLGDSLLVANWAPTELSKKPFEEPAAQHFLITVWAKIGTSKHNFKLDLCQLVAVLGVLWHPES